MSLLYPGESQQGIWQTATFDVPDGTPEESVQFRSDKYMLKFGDNLESQGFTVKMMSRPEPYKGRVPTEEGRKRYRIWAFVKRRPIEMTMDIPDIAVPEMLDLGLKLKE